MSPTYGASTHIDCRHGVRVTTSGPPRSALYFRKVGTSRKPKQLSRSRRVSHSEVVTLDLDGPKAGEVLVELKATGICHTDEFTRPGADPEGIFPAIFGHEGAGVVVDVGPGVT